MKKEKPESKLCKHCKTEIPYEAKVCPQCRKKQKGGIVSKILIVFVVFVILGAVGGTEDNSSTNKEPQKSAEQNTDTVKESKNDDTAAEKPENKLTLGQQNALGSALNYLEYSAFSYTGLIDQLEYEGYSTEDATYAVDNCGADWNEQALLKAIDYLDYSAFSYSGLVEQLEYEGFTNEQATKAADDCGADWNEQAAKKAQDYLDYSEFSRSGLIDQLKYEGFTSDQAEYGASQAGY